MGFFYHNAPTVTSGDRGAVLMFEKLKINLDIRIWIRLGMIGLRKI